MRPLLSTGGSYHPQSQPVSCFIVCGIISSSSKRRHTQRERNRHIDDEQKDKTSSFKVVCCSRFSLLFDDFSFFSLLCVLFSRFRFEEGGFFVYVIKISRYDDVIKSSRDPPTLHIRTSPLQIQQNSPQPPPNHPPPIPTLFHPTPLSSFFSRRLVDYPPF